MPTATKEKKKTAKRNQAKTQTTTRRREERSKTSLHEVRFPGESASYRAARDELLRREQALRDAVEDVARLRSSLPLGGRVEQDYLFEEEGEGGTKKVRLSELFRNGKRTLLLYNFMFGPDMEEPCSLCTSILDGLDGQAPHVLQRANLAVVAKSPIKRIRAFARGRAWRNLRLLSSAGTTYNHDYQGETADGDQMPAMNVFVKRNGGIHHFYNAELLYVPREAGRDPCHVDLIWPLWNLLDLTPEGRGDWYPSLTY